MDKILDGKKLSIKILEDIKKKVDLMPQKPTLAVILVGENPASKVYVASKEKRAKECGFNSRVIKLSDTTTKEDLTNLIVELNNDHKVNAILLQLPLPKHLNEGDFTNLIDPQKDVDGFHPINLGKLMTQTNPYAICCTPFGILKLLKEYGVELTGKNVVIIGRSNIVGKPLAQLLLNENATVTITHSKTKNLSEITKRADILISAVGKKNMVTENMVKEGAVVVDVGIIKDENGKIKGDVDFENVYKKASLITPVPGGVGPMTIATLMENTLQLFLGQN